MVPILYYVWTANTRQRALYNYLQLSSNMPLKIDSKFKTPKIYIVIYHMKANIPLHLAAVHGLCLNQVPHRFLLDLPQTHPNELVTRTTRTSNVSCFVKEKENFNEWFETMIFAIIVLCQGTGAINLIKCSCNIYKHIGYGNICCLFCSITIFITIISSKKNTKCIQSIGNSIHAQSFCKQWYPRSKVCIYFSSKEKI